MKIVNAIKARTNFGELLNEVFYGNEHVTIERAGKPMAVILPIGEYESWQKKKEEVSGKLKEFADQVVVLSQTIDELRKKQ